MNGVAFMVWSAFLILALSFFFTVFDDLLATMGQMFAIFATIFLLMAIVGWVNAAYDLFIVTQARVRSRRRWPY